MSITQEVLDLEKSDSSLADAYRILRQQWKEGDRDREVGLHLMFLAWYGIIEPCHLTGFSETKEEKFELNQVFDEVHEYYEPVIRDDAEMLYAFGLAADLFWFMFDDDLAWEKRAEEYRRLYRTLAPDGIDPRIFKDRGAYGVYYERQSHVEGGY